MGSEMCIRDRFKVTTLYLNSRTVVFLGRLIPISFLLAQSVWSSRIHRPARFGWFRSTLARFGWFRSNMARFGWFRSNMAGFGWFRSILAGFGWFRSNMAGFGWFWLILARFGWF